MVYTHVLASVLTSFPRDFIPGIIVTYGGNSTMRRVCKVEVLPAYHLGLEFDDGVTGVVDLSENVGKGVFAAWCDRLFFEQVAIGSAGELVWGEKIDLCPDALYLKLTGKQPEDLFPALRNLSTHA